jgi:hypothetical protein
MGTDRSPELTTEDIVYCARHPQVETTLRCGRCDTPICPRCLVQTPVGARCRDCANVRSLPTIDVKPVFIARGLGAALLSGLVIGGAWGWITGGRSLVGFFIFFIALGIGWAIGESVSVATNRKRSPVLQGCAVIGVVVAYLVHNAVGGAALLPQGDLWGYLATAIAAAYAASRLRA